MATLAAVPVGDELHFPRLRELLDMTAGNLSTHLSKLEGAGYVQQNKTYSGRSPATYLALTSEGRVAFERYVRNGGFVFVDDCNHDIDGLFAKSFEAQMGRIFGAKALKRAVPAARISRAASSSPPWAGPASA